jgi:putative ABC transport system substrate-binding protein
MTRRTMALLITFTLALLVVPLAIEAHQPTKIYRIGLLSPGSLPAEPNPSMDAFRQQLRELGYVEGQNLLIERGFAEETQERLRDMAAYLVRLKVDVIVVYGVAGARAAQQATRTIPIAMTGIIDPVAQGFVASMAHPGGNITGLSNLSEALFGKRLELLKETVPQSARIAALVNPALPRYRPLMSHLTAVAQALGQQLHVVELRRAEELDTAFVRMAEAGVDTLVVVGGGPQLIESLREQIGDLATKHRLPTMCSWKMYVDAGCLMSYGPSLPDMFRRVAIYTDKILKGAKPVDLPIEQPTTFELVINLRTAEAIGLTIPPALLFQATEVVR